MRFMPTESEVKMLRQYERERRPMDGVTDEDRFMMLFSKIERLPQRMTIMAFMGNFNDSLQMLTPVRWKEKKRDNSNIINININKEQSEMHLYICLFAVAVFPTATACYHSSICIHKIITEIKENP